ncbi:hypothetical protein ACFQ7F_02865 [Streptomyces sp. NPDC056486]|uniref:hypothetical protein n=1 Tax=Streptomyces sp. NPDC056486 TaxID=3345835 RepID=UPI003693EC4F
MASGLRDTVYGERRTAARCTVFGVSLATLLAVLCVCFGSSAHHDDPSPRAAVSTSAPMAGSGGPASVGEASLGHSCPPGDRCASVTHAAAIALPAPEPSVPTTLGEAGLPAAPATALPVPREPVHRYAPDLHVLQVQRT